MHRSRHAVALFSLALILSACGLIGGGTSPEAESWELAGVDGNQVFLRVLHGACDKFDHVDVRESPTEVSIAVIHAVADGDCKAIGLIDCRVVTLQAPLGDRRLVYASPEPVPNSSEHPTPRSAPNARETKPVPPEGTTNAC